MGPAELADSAESMRSGVKLGIDVGTVRVGLAAADRDSILAFPVSTLSRDAKKNSDIKVVLRHARERAAVLIYVGLPRTLRGGESGSALMAREYAELLVQALATDGMDVSVRLIDERLSSVSAHSSLRSAGMSGREQRKVVDQVAAAGILQHALDMEKSLHKPAGALVQPDKGNVVGRVDDMDTTQEKDFIISSHRDHHGEAL